MKKIVFILIIFVNTNCQNSIYILGNALNTKAVSNADGINASETTVHSLDDVSQSKSHSQGDAQSNARTSGQSIWNQQLQGTQTSADSIQKGNGDTSTDSWSKQFQPTSEFYLNNYYSYLKFLQSLSGQKSNEDLTQNLQQKINESIKPNDQQEKQTFGDYSFDMQQSRSAGFNTWSSTNSQIFSWNGNKIHKGSVAGSAQDGWTTINSTNWSQKNDLQNIVNKNSTAFGQNAYTSGESSQYFKNDNLYHSGSVWSEADGKDAITLSQINNNSFGQGSLSGNSNAYSDQNGTQAVSDYKGYLQQQLISQFDFNLCFVLNEGTR